MEDYVTYEQSIKLKELGGDWECYKFYNPDKSLGEYTDLGCGADFRDWNNEFNEQLTSAVASAPILTQAQKWLREEKGIYVQISRYNLNNFAYELKFYHDFKEGYVCQGFWTPEKALQRGIDEALELLK